MQDKVRIDESAFIAPTATIMGDVTVEEQASIWYGCVLRAEAAPIVIGPRTNVQDLTVVHTDPGQPCRLGAGVTVGHRAVVHSATIGDGALIGIGAIVLNGAQVGEGAIVGAGAVVTEGMVIPPRVLALGVPAKVVRELKEEDVMRVQAGAAWYVQEAQAYQKRERGNG